MCSRSSMSKVLQIGSGIVKIRTVNIVASFSGPACVQCRKYLITVDI